tara:strand:- start:413 stop:817 length:405 start_codon:yes stop_codon:yes gene_type:complete
MSLVKTDALQGKTTAKTVTVTVGATATQALEAGLCKAWIHFDGTSGTPITRDSINMSAISDLGTGDYRVNFVANFDNGYYASSGTGANTQYFFAVDQAVDPTTSNFTMRFTYAPSTTSDNDIDNVSTIHIGELA